MEIAPYVAGLDLTQFLRRLPGHILTREPHVEPGQIWVTEEFGNELARQPSLWRTSPTGVGGEDRFNARKADEPDLWVVRAQITLRARRPAMSSVL